MIFTEFCKSLYLVENYEEISICTNIYFLYACMQDKRLITFNMYDTWIHMQSRTNPYKSFFSALWILWETSKKISKLLLTTDQPLINILPQEIVSRTDFEQTLFQLDRDIQTQLASIFVYPDFLPTVDFLRGRWYKLAVVSNLSTPYAYPLTHLIWADVFDYKILSYEVGEIKPNTWIFEALWKKSWIHPDDTLMIGDSFSSDIQWALHTWIDAVHLVRNSWWVIEKDSYMQIWSLSDLKSIL